MAGANPAYQAARLRLLLEAEGGDKRMGLEDWKAKQEDDARARMDQVRRAGAPPYTTPRSRTKERAFTARQAILCGVPGEECAYDVWAQRWSPERHPERCNVAEA